MTNNEFKYYKVFFKYYVKILQHIIYLSKSETTNHGASHGRAKLSERNVAQIKFLLEENKLTQRCIAKQYNISAVNIYYIKTGKIWGWVEPKDFKNIF